jgi:hypothetical protein
MAGGERTRCEANGRCERVTADHGAFVAVEWN